MMTAFRNVNLLIPAIITDKQPAVIGFENGRVKLCLADQILLKFLLHHPHGATHDKFLNTNNVVKPVIKIVNYIHTQSQPHAMKGSHR